jgi:hypothetical protein
MAADSSGEDFRMTAFYNLNFNFLFTSNSCNSLILLVNIARIKLNYQAFDLIFFEKEFRCISTGTTSQRASVAAPGRPFRRGGQRFAGDF